MAVISSSQRNLSDAKNIEPNKRLIVLDGLILLGRLR